MEQIGAVLAIALLIGVPFLFASKKLSKHDRLQRASHERPEERSGAVQAGYDVLHPGSQ
jgi:hypothetical protein